MFEGLKGDAYKVPKVPLIIQTNRDPVPTRTQPTEAKEPLFFTQIKDEVPPHYLKYYINYDRVKLHLQRLCKSVPESAHDHHNTTDFRTTLISDFKGVFRSQLEKVNDFATMQAKKIVCELNRFVTHHEALVVDATMLSSPGEIARIVSTGTHKLLCLNSEIVHLDRFARSNLKMGARLIQLFRCGLEIHDNDTPGVNIRAGARGGICEFTELSYLQSELENEVFCNLDIDSLVLFLSVGWERLRRVSEYTPNAKDNEGVWKPPTSFVRNTTKYWVSPDRLVDVKCAITRYMPFLIFGKNVDHFAELLEDAATQDSSMTCGPDPVDSQLVSSVYLDNPQGYSYRSRIMRYEGAKLVRYRWYGHNNGNDDKPIYIERKTHHEGWTGLDSTKERFILDQKDVHPFLTGDMSRDNLSSKLGAKTYKTLQVKTDTLKLAQEIHDLQRRVSLVPMLRTSYHRCAFQLSSNNEVRFSLDHNLCMINEHKEKQALKASQFWCKTATDVIAEDGLVRFPFAVLEVKLQTQQPEWVSDMLESCGAIAVHKFSKFQHGMAMLHRKRILGAPLPHWVEECVDQGWIPGFAAKGGPAMLSQQNPAFNSALKYNSALLRSVAGSVHNLDFRSQVGHYQSVMGANFSMPMQLLSLQGGFTNNNRSRLTSVAEDIEGDYSKGTALCDEEATYKWYQIQRQQTASQREDARMMFLRDPKVQFAAERVFLKYCRKAIYLLPFSYLAFENESTVPGTLISLATISLVIYGWVQFTKRIGILEFERVKGTHPDDRPYIHSMLGPKLLLGTVLFCYCTYALYF